MIKMRRSMLFLPGNNPGMLQNGGVFAADSVILDIEDAVAPPEKDAARLLVAEALCSIDYGGSERVVRINPLETFAEQDIAAIVPCRPDTLLIPKVQSAQDIMLISQLVARYERHPDCIRLIALLETPQGIAQAYNIACADERLAALALGAEDYTAALGASRSRQGEEIYFARMMVINAAAAAGIQSIDTPFTDVDDVDGLRQDTRLAKQLGFKGKLVINPRQVDIIHDVFNPTDGDIAWAVRVLAAMHQAEAEGAGVASLQGKMIDAPIVNRAEQTVQLARKLGLIKEGL